MIDAESGEHETDVQQQINVETEEATEALAVVSDIEITCDKDEEFIAEILADVKGKNKRVEEMKQRALKPMRDSIKEIQSWFRPVQSAYSEMERELKDKVLGYRKQLEQDRQEAREAMQGSETVEEARDAKSKLEVAQAPETAGIKVIKLWGYRVVQMDSIPAQYIQLNKGAIRQAINAGTRDISGLEIFQKETVSSASK